MNKGEGDERRRGLYPPPFLGPASQADMGFYKEHSPVPDHPSSKSKKSLVDKISRTLDKLATVGRESGKEDRRSRSSHPTGLVYPIYPGYQPAYRTVRGPHGVPYQYVYGSPGWPENAALYKDYGNSPQNPGPWCRCPDQGKDSIRGTRSSQCKHCGKGRSPYVTRPSPSSQMRPRARLPNMLPDTGGVTRSPSSAWDTGRTRGQSFNAGPKDPYDYIRRTKLKAEEWDTYWETGSYNSPSQGRGQRPTPTNTVSTPPTKSHGPGMSPSLRGGEERRTRTVDARQRVVEDDSKILDVKISNDNSVVETQERIPTPVKSSSSPLSPSSPSPPPEIEEPNQEDNDSDLHLSAALLADLVTMKSKISVAEMRYRKFQRRNPLRKLSLQIDDVIMEEDEEALENEEKRDREDIQSSSDDELGIGKFHAVVGATDMADEILSEIYGTKREVVTETGIKSGLSLTEEILEELYGTSGHNTDDVKEEDRYCSIDDILEEEEEETESENIGNDDT